MRCPFATILFSFKFPFLISSKINLCLAEIPSETEKPCPTAEPEVDYCADITCLNKNAFPVGWVLPAAVAVRGLDLIPLNFPLGCGSGSDPPQYPPWVWAWNLIPLNFPLGCGPGPDSPQFPPWVWAWI